MDMSQFSVQICRLRDTYGQRSYPREIVIGLYAQLRHISNERFEKAINRLLAENTDWRRPPNVKNLEALIKTIPHDKPVETPKKKGESKTEKEVSEFMREVIGSLE